MTFSVVAYDPESRSWGVAAASKFLAVGARLPVAEVDVGAIATQAEANLTYREKGISLLRTGLSAPEVVSQLTSEDADREVRQLAVVDRAGSVASWTGAHCHEYASSSGGVNYSIQGNRLVGPAVLSSMVKEWDSSGAYDTFARRLMAALAAGDLAGGDRRGRQSASILVVRKGAGYAGSDVEIDFRVDDSVAPVAELLRIVNLYYST